MSVLIHKDTKVIVQGITGKAARFHTEQMQKYGTNIVGGTHQEEPVKSAAAYRSSIP